MRRGVQFISTMGFSSQLLVTFAWGGLMALERKAFLQAMLSRPLVCAPTLGWFLGDVTSGLAMGVVLEWFYLGSASLGAAIPENETLAATGATSAVLGLSQGMHRNGGAAEWAFCLLLFLGLGTLGRKLDRWLEGFSTRSAERATVLVQEGRLALGLSQNVRAMAPPFFIFGAVTALCFSVGILLAPVYAEFSPHWLKGLSWAYAAMAAMAASLAIRGSRARSMPLWAGASLLVLTAAAIRWAKGLG